MNRRSSLARVSALSALLLVGSALLSCGGGGGGGGGGTTDLEALFTPDANPAGASLVLDDGSVSGDLFDLRVMVDSIDDFYGAAFRVTFDTNVLDFVQSSGTGSFLAAGGAATDFTASEADPGVVFVSASRRDEALGGVDVSPSPQLLVTLTFRALDETAGSDIDFVASFREVQVCATAGQPCIPLSPVAAWAGGAVVVTAN